MKKNSLLYPSQRAERITLADPAAMQQQFFTGNQPGGSGIAKPADYVRGVLRCGGGGGTAGDDCKMQTCDLTGPARGPGRRSRGLFSTPQPEGYQAYSRPSVKPWRKTTPRVLISGVGSERRKMS